jgi:hypothetical protein
MFSIANYIISKNGDLEVGMHFLNLAEKKKSVRNKYFIPSLVVRKNLMKHKLFTFEEICEKQKEMGSKEFVFW